VNTAVNDSIATWYQRTSNFVVRTSCPFPVPRFPGPAKPATFLPDKPRARDRRSLMRILPRKERGNAERRLPRQ
jgi:hypothetical protein